MAAAVLDAMARNARNGALRQYIGKRARQARGLADLVDAVGRYQARTGRMPAVLNDLVRAGLMSQLPEDPLGMGYELDGDGKPVIRQRKAEERDEKQAKGLK